MSLLASSLGRRCVSVSSVNSVVRCFATTTTGASAASTPTSNASNPRFPPPPKTTLPSAVFDYRRLANRSKWGPPIEEDPDVLVITDKHLGRNPDLNWTINRYQITPRVEAFRNLHARGLRMFVSGTQDANKALHVSYTVPAAHDTFVVGIKTEDGKPPAGIKTVTNDQLKGLFREVRRYLSEVDKIFVHDGLVGEENARIFTENAAVALALNQLLPATRLGNVADYTHTLTAYIVPSLPPNKTIPNGLGGNFTLFDVEKKNLFVIGNPSISTIRDALAEAASYNQRESGLVLSGDVLVAGDRSVLVLSKDNSFLPSALSSSESNLFAGNKIVWTKSGLTRLFDGVSHASGTFQKGDLVENKKHVNRSGSFSHGYSAPHPSTVVFFGQDIPNIAEGASKLSAKQVSTNASTLLQGSPLGENGQTSRFEALLKESGAEVILFNKKGTSATKDIIKSLLGSK